ncbi:hypothetical protein, partial [Archangium sp.]|uniref:hypothetical protein n=1 Tax=Archangium sp. TaxID=1872627 RepID=UPI00389A2AFB
GLREPVIKLWHAATEREVLAGRKGKVDPQRFQFHVRRAATYWGKGNYGGTLTVWDVVFGTARWPESETATAPVGLPPRAREPFGFRKEMLYFLSGWRGQRS